MDASYRDRILLQNTDPNWHGNLLDDAIDR